MSINIARKQVEIQGVVLEELAVHPDDRGSFCEVFRSSWFPRCNYGEEIQLNLSRTAAGSLRGLHFHRKQYDWWIPVHGKVQAVLADLRTGSPTFGKTMCFHLSSGDSTCVLIPPGVAHGFLALSDVSLIYAVDRFYDGTDEQGVAWNDEELSVPWENGSPVLSDRDTKNPTLADLRAGSMLPG